MTEEFPPPPKLAPRAALGANKFPETLEFVGFPEDRKAFIGHLKRVGKKGKSIFEAADMRTREGFAMGVSRQGCALEIIARFSPDTDAERKLITENVVREWNRLALREPKKFATDSVIPLDVRAKKQPIKKIAPTPYIFKDPTTIPPRPWIMRPYYLRKKVTLTAAMGGVGKSTFVMAEMIAMATGKPLLNLPMQSDKPLNVWYWNGEDDDEELDRKFAAINLHYDLTAGDYTGNLYRDYGRTLPIKIGVLEDGVAKIVDFEVDRLVEAINDFKIDVLAVDPFVTTHGLSENVADQMELVARKWTHIADQTNSAIGIVHHNRKTGGAAGTIEDSRGSTAVIAATRVRRAVNQMTEAQAKAAGIPVEQRRFYISVDDALTNVKPPSTGLDWYKLESVNLENDPARFEGDDIGVVTPYKYAALEHTGPDDIEHGVILKALGARDKWRADTRSVDWVGSPIGAALGYKVLVGDDHKTERKRVNTIINRLLADHVLVECEGVDEKRNKRQFYSLNTILPQSSVDASLTEAD